MLALFDSSLPFSAEDEQLIGRLEGKKTIAVINKTDLVQRLDERLLTPYFDQIVRISAKQETGVKDLHNAITHLLKISDLDPNAPMLANERQRRAAVTARQYIAEAKDALVSGMTLDAVTISAESAVEALLELTGERVTDAVVDEVFSHFCVGK